MEKQGKKAVNEFPKVTQGVWRKAGDGTRLSSSRPEHQELSWDLFGSVTTTEVALV